MSVPGFVDYGWTGGEPRGTYLFFLAAFRSGSVSLADLVGAKAAAFTFP